jgi:hypothetical protein
MKKIPLTLAMVVLGAAAVRAADVSGTWEAKVKLGDQTGSPTFTLQQAGESLTGTYSGVFGEAPVTGTVKGDNVTIDFEVSGYKIHYAGKLDSAGKSMEGTVDYGELGSGTFTATRKESREKK